MSRRLLSAAVLALVLALCTGVPVGCSEECGTSCGEPAAYIEKDGLPQEARATLCIDDDCRDLQDDETFHAWVGFQWEVPQEDSHVRAAVRNAEGNVVATYDGVGRPAPCSCGVIDLRFDGDELFWRRE